MKMILSGDVWLHARSDGPQEAPAVLLLNSLGTDLRIWDALASGLTAAGRRVIRFDKPGHGLSESRPRPCAMQGLAQDAFAVLDGFGIEKAHVVGLSIGGQIALAMAAARPERLASLVLSNSAPKIGSPEMWRARIAAIEAGGLESLADGVMERWFSPAYRAAEPGLLAAWRSMFLRCGPEGYLGCCEALAASDLTAAAAALRLPVHVIGGSEDGATPPDLVREAAARIPGAGFTLIEGAGHLPCVENPEAVSRLLRAFWERPS